METKRKQQFEESERPRYANPFFYSPFSFIPTPWKNTVYKIWPMR